MTHDGKHDAEAQRLEEDARRTKNWKRWGPYLSERQWATVREDYSPDGNCWVYFPHDHARSRAYRWGEDGLLGITDRECRLCFALALWNERDPILKERLFGLTNPEGNHGGGRQGVLLLPGLHPDPLLPEGALQISAGRVPLRPAAGGEPPPGPEGARVRAGRDRRLRRGPLLRRAGRVRQGRAGRHPHPHHRCQPRPRGGAAPPAPHALVPQHLVVGQRLRGGLVAEAAPGAGR